MLPLAYSNSESKLKIGSIFEKETIYLSKSELIPVDKIYTQKDA